MIRIVIAEDQRMVLGALGSLLDLEEDMEVVGKANNGEEALKLIVNYNPMFVLWILKCLLKVDWMPQKN